MKNIPIIAKFLSVMGIFGVFAVAVAVYSTSQMRGIDNAYTALMAGNAAATIDIARANRNLESARSDIGDLMIANTPAENDAAKTAMATAEQTFSNYMDKAAPISGRSKAKGWTWSITSAAGRSPRA